MLWVYHACCRKIRLGCAEESNSMPARPVIPDSTQWFSYEALPMPIPEIWKHWLLDTGSLTSRLKSTFSGQFKVDVISQNWGYPTHSERHFLSMNNGEQANIREVLLICKKVPRVFARSILPASSLTGKNRELLFLSDRPLGEFIFSQPNLERGPIEITRTYNLQGQTVWGRRSKFLLDNKPLAVCEYFLPEVYSPRPDSLRAGATTL